MWLRRPGRRRPALTLCVTAHNASDRLGWLLDESRCYADEIVVGVDRSSADETWDAAVAGADRVFGFRQTAGAGPARLAGLERATGDWVLFLDDDEGMDAAFPERRDELLSAAWATHWWLPRKWVVSLDPPQALAALPWAYDPQLRLVRGDVTRVDKPATIHSGLRVIGTGGHVAEGPAILHYEPLDRTADEREAKLERYRARGHSATDEALFRPPPDSPRTLLDPPPLRGRSRTARPRRPARIDALEEDLDRARGLPNWRAEVEVVMPASARPGELLEARALARNTGRLRWVPSEAQWPLLRLGLQIRHADGRLEDSGVRAPVGQDVPPGASAQFHFVFRAPEAPGRHELVWDMVCELESWFCASGSSPCTALLTVTGP